MEPSPFDAARFRSEVDGGEEEDDEALRIKLESTIRWRYGQGSVKESNARLVRWSDGSWSLLLGDEMFDVVLAKSEGQDYQYLVATYRNPDGGQGAFQTQMRLKEHMSFRPAGLHSNMHKKLTASIAAKHKKEAKTRLTEVDIDPDKVKEEAEKVISLSKVQ